MWEAKEEARYLPKAIDIVRVMWPDYSAQLIAMEITKRCQCKCDVKLVYALKARLDTARRNRPQ